jgi:hypothetical protein
MEEWKKVVNPTFSGFQHSIIPASHRGRGGFNAKVFHFYSNNLFIVRQDIPREIPGE